MWKFIIPALLIVTASLLHVFESQENFFYDVFLQLRPLQKVSPDIAIIEIDDRTLNQLGQWPLPRDFHASLLDVLEALGAKTVVFDLVFSEPTGYDPAFWESIKKAGNVILPEVFFLPEHLTAQDVLKRSNPILAGITKTLNKGAIGVGQINVLLDADGKFRKVPLFVRNGNALVPHLGLEAACRQLQINCKNVLFERRKVTVGGRISIPVQDSDELLVNFPGKWRDTFRHFSYLEILSGYRDWKVNQKSLGQLSDIKGKVCFVGLTAVGTVDLKASPLEKLYPMVGLDASVCNSVLERKFLQRAPGWTNALAALLVYFLCVFVCVRFRPWAALLCCVGIGVLSFIAASLLMDFTGVWMDIFLVSAVILLVYVLCVSVRWAKERHKLEILEKEMAIGKKIQMQFLKGPKQEIPDLDMAVCFQPAQYVAGDFYDVFKLDAHKTGIMIADVSGKGLPAALCMAQTISLFRIFSRQIPGPDETLTRLNQELCLRDSERFVTALYCVIDAEHETINIASAGQGPAYIHRDGQEKIEELEVCAHPPMGVMDNTVYHAKIYTVHKKDKLFLFSDGIYESRTIDGKELGIEKVKEAILANIRCPNKEILENVISMINESSGKGVQHDDMTMIIFSLKI